MRSLMVFKALICGREREKKKKKKQTTEIFKTTISLFRTGDNFAPSI